MFAIAPWRKRSKAPLARADNPFGWMSEEYQTLFNRIFSGWPVLEMPEWPTAWDVTTEEKEKEVVIRTEMPGFQPTELKVEVVGDRLMVKAEHKEPAEKGEKAEEKAKPTYRHVKRVMTLPPEVDLA